MAAPSFSSRQREVRTFDNHRAQVCGAAICVRNCVNQDKKLRPQWQRCCSVWLSLTRFNFRFDCRAIQVSLLRRAQISLAVPTYARYRPGYALGVIAMHPVGQRLAIHATQRCRLRPRPPLQHQRQRQKTANLPAIFAGCREIPQICCRVFSPCHLDRCTHQSVHCANRRRRSSSQNSAPLGIPHMSQRFRGLVCDLVIMAGYESLPTIAKI